MRASACAQLGRARLGAEADQQVADRRPREAGLEQPEQERHGRQADREEGRPLDPGEGHLAPGAVGEQEGDHDQGDGERVDEQGDPEAPRPARGPPAQDQDHDPGEHAGAERGELDPGDDQPGVRVLRDLEQVVGAVVAERHVDDLEADGADVGHGHDRPLGGSSEAAAGVGQEDVQEERGGDEVEGLPEREQRRGVGEVERRDEHRRARGDHQRPEAGVGAAPPRDRAPDRVGEHDPREQHGLPLRLGRARGGHRHGGGGRGGGDAGEGHGPHHRPRWGSGDDRAPSRGRLGGRGHRPHSHPVSRRALVIGGGVSSGARWHIPEWRPCPPTATCCARGT